MKKWTNKIPSILWIPIIIGLIVAFLGLGWGLFYGIGYVEGFSSIALLVLGWFGFRIANNSDELATGGFVVACGICFYALMGMALDQTGNYFYNKPIEWLFCPPGSELLRNAASGVSPRGGTTVVQVYGCVANGGAVVRQISGPEQLGVRFGEYVVLGYILLGASRLFGNLKRRLRKENETDAV